ncbi:hypothetical protein [Massilia glaciei]|uniref:hypothetical protein n=1 Tax=Massilia glaciei TaxID=1524097 RepID=UPI0011B1DA78|nr:hypothetical protein [Massilia glaciei]
MKSKKIAFSIVLLLFVFAAFAALTANMLFSRIPKNPELALKSFYEREVAEDQMMDPLILAGEPVVSLLAKEVENPNMLHRRYAIGALGNLKSKAALPTLEKLSRTSSEHQIMRCDSLVAIGMIDHAEGLRVAASIESERLQCLWDVVGHHTYSSWLKSGAPRRTYLAALLGWHH